MKLRTRLNGQAVLAAVSILALSAATQAQEPYYWNGAGTGGNTATDPANPTTLWSEAGNWEDWEGGPGQVPEPDDTASIRFTNAGSSSRGLAT